MNTIHDLGGMDGFEIPERDQGPVLKEQWEREVWGVALSLIARQFSEQKMIMSRADIERIPPALYLSMPYYAKWLHAWEQALINAGIVTRQELDDPETAVAAGDASPIGPDEVIGFLTHDLSYELPASSEPRFGIGDAVVVRNEHPIGHTRAPRYTRGRRGIIQRHHGLHVFEDQLPEEQHPGPQHLYTVTFTARELWGSRGHPHDRIHADLTEFHLDAAD